MLAIGQAIHPSTLILGMRSGVCGSGTIGVIMQHLDEAYSP